MVLMAPAGHLKFPLTGQYDNNLDCTWKISAPFGTVIKSAAFNCQFISGTGGSSDLWRTSVVAITLAATLASAKRSVYRRQTGRETEKNIQTDN